jgi:hypothetical protein
MKKFHIKIDPDLSVQTQAFGARVDDDNVFIPQKLAQVLERFSLGDDATSIAGFLTDFPTSLTGALGLSLDAVIAAGNAFTKLIEESGADVSSVRRRVDRRPRGAKHPGQMNHRGDFCPT